MTHLDPRTLVQNGYDPRPTELRPPPKSRQPSPILVPVFGPPSMTLDPVPLPLSPSPLPLGTPLYLRLTDKTRNLPHPSPLSPSP